MNFNSEKNTGDSRILHIVELYALLGPSVIMSLLGCVCEPF